ncbi:hypothetical protein [Cytobacillus praedii]|uniref:hypothetical protein n=1 Tax=Cytobacillus praedii TaxID=1742358 RepID=UPI0013F4AE3C|nr:hypothetical protein [Cytobacillus praedii]
MEVKINGKLIYGGDMSHEEFIYKLMKALDSQDLSFHGKTSLIEDIVIYNK